MIQVLIIGHPDGVEPVVHTGVGYIYGARGSCLGEGFDGPFAEVRIPDGMSNRTGVEGVFYPLFKITLPGYVEYCPGSPEEDDCQVTEVGGEDFLV